MTLEPTSTISPTNSWPTTSGVVDRLGRPRVPRLDVQVGAADAGLADADQDVVDAGDRVRDGLQREARFGGGLDEGEHCAAPASRFPAAPRGQGVGRGSSVQSTRGFSTLPMPSISHTDAVARLEEHRRVTEHPDARGRAGGDEVAGLERDVARDEADQLRDVVEHVGGVPVLHEDRSSRRPRRSPGYASCGADRPAVGSISSGVTNTGPTGQERVGALGAQPLAVALLALRQRLRVALPVAGAHVVDDHVARDEAGGLLDGHPATGPADDDAELHLEVEGVRPLGPDDRLAVPDDGVGELGEQHRPVGGGAATLLRVVAVVQPDAHDLAGLDVVHRRCRAALVGIEEGSAGLERPPGGAPELAQPVVLKADLEADALVGVDRRVEPASLLELGTGQQAARGRGRRTVRRRSDRSRRTGASGLPQLAAGLGCRGRGRGPTGGDAGDGTAHWGSGGATNVPSTTRSPYRLKKS